MFGLPALLDSITSSFQAVNYSVHHLPFFSHFSKWRKHSERGRLGHGNSGHTSIPGSRYELQAGTTPFLATATRGFPSKNPPDRLPVLLKSRSRNEFLADLLRPHAALVEKTRRNRRMRGCAGGRPPRERGRPELHPAAARASAAAADTRACGSSAPDWIYLLTITAKEQGHCS